MKYTYCIPAALALALVFTAPVMAADKAADKAQEPAAAANMDGQALKGKVVETMNTGGYTYILLDASQGKIWVAIPEAKVEVGQEITANPGMTMSNFESKTLGKTFDSIIFSSGLGGDKAAKPHGGAAMGGAMGGGSSFAAAMQAEGANNPHAKGGGAMNVAEVANASGGSSTAIVPAAEIKMDKAEGKNGQTVADCFSNAKDLDKKKVQVRGKVMKVSKMIMGKNWVHLQDGTGDPLKNTHDLVVTTQADPEKDSVIVIEGVLYANKDFGAGYKYEVIIEDAEIK